MRKIVRTFFISIILLYSLGLEAQVHDSSFFPLFTPYSQNPVLSYGDAIPGSPWNDPCVLKINGQYIMYTSGVQGGLNHPNDTIATYRWVSNDGYNWNLNPSSPVLDAKAGTYYRGGVETPSVVFYKGQFHLYNTVYTQNSPFQFKISHATSTNGINWQIDTTVVLEPATNTNWMNLIVAEPGALVKDDTLLLFFTALGSSGGQQIGLLRSIDGKNFIDTTLAVSIPNNVYPNGNNYVGLSTPSACMVQDTIYLFTDVAQNVFGNNWMQVALHQFKSFGNIQKWYADTLPIHTRMDFPWSNGNYNAEIRSITPLLDGNRLRIWYAGHNISEIDTSINDTTNHVHFIGNELHVDSGYWAFGTSEFLFPNLSNLPELAREIKSIQIEQKQQNWKIRSDQSGKSKVIVYRLNGQILFEKQFHKQVEFTLNYSGMVIIQVQNPRSNFTAKYLSIK